MAYEQKAGSSSSQPDNLLDSTKKNLNPWQDKSTNNYLGGYHGNVAYETTAPPQLDSMLQETDDGWSEWPDEWEVEDSDQCMSNGFANGFNGQSPYSQQSQIPTSQPQPQNFGHFFNQFATTIQQKITQPKVESTSPNSFFDNVQLDNSVASTPGNTAHLFQQASMAAESATVRTGVSYAAALSGNAEAPEQNNGQFDDINLNDNTETGFNEEANFAQPEPSLPAASFTPFPVPMPEKMERSATHLFSRPTVSGTSHDDPFGSAAEPSLENDNDFDDERTIFAQEQHQKDNLSYPSVQESFGCHPTPAKEEQRLPEIPSKEFDVPREPSNASVPSDIEDSFASNQPFSYPSQEQKQPEMPSHQTEEATYNAFEVHRERFNASFPQSIEDSFASNQSFSYPTQEQKQPEMALMPSQQTEETVNNSFGVHSVPSVEHSDPIVVDSFASHQPCSYHTQEQRQPERSQESVFATGPPSQIADSFGIDKGSLCQTVEQANQVVPDIRNTFAVNQPAAAMEDQRSSEDYSQQPQSGNNVQDHFGVDSPSQDQHNESVVHVDAMHEMAWEKDGTSMTAPGEPLHDRHQDHIASKDTTPQIPWQQADATQATPFSQPSEMVSCKVSSISIPEVSPDTSEGDSSSTHDTSSNSNQSQIETAAWREDDVPTADTYGLEQNTVPPSSMMNGNTVQDGPRKVAHFPFHSAPPPTDIGQPGKVEGSVPGNEFLQHEQSAPLEDAIPPPPVTVDKKEHDVPKSGSHQLFHPGSPLTNMVQPPPVGKVEEDVPNTSAQTYFQPGPQPTNMVPPPPMSVGKDVPKTSGQAYFQSVPPLTHLMQPSHVATDKMEDVPKTSMQTYVQPVPTPTHIVQPSHVATDQMDDVPKTSAQAYFQPGSTPTHIVQPSHVAGDKMDDILKTSTQTYVQPGPPPAQTVQPSHVATDKMEDVQKTSAQAYFQPGPPPAHIMQSSPVANEKREDAPKGGGGYEYFQPAPPPPSIGQLHPTTAGKMQEQSAPPPINKQKSVMVIGKKEELNQPPPASTMPPSGIYRKPLHEHSQSAPPASTVSPVPMFPKASHMEHNAKPAKTSTPEPPMPPESGPMAMTKRATRQEKSRTPVSLSSSLWSTNVPTAISPAIMLAPALQQPAKPAVPSPAASGDLQPKQDLSDPQALPSDQETKGDSVATLSKKDRKAEKKRLKALKKEQKKLKQDSKTHVESSSSSTTLPSTSTPNQDSSHHHPTHPPKESSLHALSTGTPVGNPQSVQESGHHVPEREQHHEKHTRGDEFGAQHKEVGNPHGNPHYRDHGMAKELAHHLSQHYGKYDGSDEHGIGYPHRGEHRSRYTEEHGEERCHSRQKNVEDESQYYSNPRVQELREECPSQVSQRQSEHLSHQDYTPRHEDRDPYQERHSASHVLRTSREDFQERSFRGNEHYDDFRHNTSREYDDHHGPRYGSEHDYKLDRDHRYTRDRRDAEGYKNNDSYDHYKRGHPRDDYDYYSSRRSREDQSRIYLDRSFDSQYDRGRPERSSREELDSYRNDYYRDNADRGIFKPINDHHYGEYKEPYRSNTPSSGSGRSTPTGHNYGHDPYYGYQQQPHQYPGYEHHYGYYPGPYGMPYHYPPPGYYHGYGPYYDYYHQYGAFGSGHGSQYSSGEGSYHDNQVNEEQQAEESALEKDQQEGEVQEVAPLRTTPLHFLRPHMTCRFGPAGQLLVTLPHHPHDGQKPLVQMATLKAIFSIEEQEQIEAFPGPLSSRGTMKRQVIEYVQAKSDEIQQSSSDVASQQARWVLWKFLLSLIKHNGAVVAEDIAEMLMLSVQHFEKKNKKTKKKRHQSEDSSSSDSLSDDDSSDDSLSDSSDDEESSEEDNGPKPVDHLLAFRALLLEGKTKEALEYAMNNSMWAHAVLLGGLMDTKVNNSMLDSKNSSSIISRFLMTLEEKDPLKTVYEHLGGKVPHAIKHHTNWASNLAGIIANPTSFPEKDKETIITLGDTLAKHPDLLLASHLCYLLAGLRPGTPGTNSKMVLIGCEHRSKKCDKFESLEALQLTELYEYASSLETLEFFLPGLQMFRYFYATRLIDAGYHKQALEYLQCVGDLMIKHPHSFNETMKKNVYKATEQLVGCMEQFGTHVELFIQSWLKKFNNAMEGKDSGISLPQQESEIEDDEDPMAQSSMSYFSGYEHPLTHNEKPSPASSPYTHNTVSRTASIQSTHSVPSVHSQQSLDPISSDIYQPSEPIEHKESFSSQGYLDQNDGPVGQEYQTRQPTESIDTWQQQQQQQQFGNDMWMPSGTQQNNSWMPTEGRGTSPEDGETTPVNASQSFEDFYHQANPMIGRVGNWKDETATIPARVSSDSSLPSKDISECKEEKKDTKAADKNKPAQSSGFWNGITGLVKTLIPKGPKEVHLPDDKNKTIYFDKELDKWINTDESDEDKAPPPPPPTDAMIGGMSGPPSLGQCPGGNPMGSAPGNAMGGALGNPMAGAPGNPMAGALGNPMGGSPGNPMTGAPGMMPLNSTMPTLGTMNTQAESVPDNSRAIPGSPGGPGSIGNNQQPLSGLLPGMQTPGKPAGSPSKFSRKAQGQFGSRKKYVDVLNPNKGSQASSLAVPSALFPVIPAGGVSFQGTLFVPSAAPADNDADNSSSQPPTDIHSGQDNPQPPSPTEQEGEQLQKAPPQPTFFDPSNFQPQPQSHSMARRGRGRYPGGYNK